MIDLQERFIERRSFILRLFIGQKITNMVRSLQPQYYLIGDTDV